MVPTVLDAGELDDQGQAALPVGVQVNARARDAYNATLAPGYVRPVATRRARRSPAWVARQRAKAEAREGSEAYLIATKRRQGCVCGLRAAQDKGGQYKRSGDGKAGQIDGNEGWCSHGTRHGER